MLTDSGIAIDEFDEIILPQAANKEKHEHQLQHCLQVPREHVGMCTCASEQKESNSSGAESLYVAFVDPSLTDMKRLLKEYLICYPEFPDIVLFGAPFYCKLRFFAPKPLRK